ncbi:uncharacterized protein EI90DRAFT_3029512 [Cantharellus anzutake]|uniref:uncharacterized protein n=1 Tax=Cantharellus anzutake TaxID=1750568 RepID=UPI0019068356|nr:uncharacterized protein EI90DRAFT_3029512 [Cantharellus anzutake]KAF8342590.1 hypothetical protein EI90DRAFT_3029512 [Cantharellus anzutake]
MEKKRVPDDPSQIPLVRGRGIIRGAKPEALCQIALQEGARRAWDPRFLERHALARYGRRSYKFYSIERGAASVLVSQRDIVGVHDAIFHDDGTIEAVQTSVPNDARTPETSGKVRANLKVAGFVFRPSGETDTDVTYLVKVNPNGSIPAAIASRIVGEIPQCVVNIAKFFHSDGFVPYIPHSLVFLATLRYEKYEHSSRSYRAGFIGASAEELHIVVDNKTMYHDRYDIEVAKDNGDTVEGIDIIQEPGLIKIKLGDQVRGQKFFVKTSRKRKVIKQPRRKEPNASMDPVKWDRARAAAIEFAWRLP